MDTKSKILVEALFLLIVLSAVATYYNFVYLKNFDVVPVEQTEPVE